MLTALVAAVTLTAPSGAVAETAAGRAVPDPISLSRGWQYSPDHASWQAVSVPHVFNPQPLASDFAGTVGWYRVQFKSPSTPGFGWALRFEQVRRVADIWLNGEHLGTSSDPYVPFTFAAKSLRPGRTNTLVVRVDNRKGKEPREGWWNWGGITRPVSLVPLGRVGVHDVGLMPKLVGCYFAEACSAKVLLDGLVLNRSTRLARPSVEVTLHPPHGGPVTRHTVPVRALRPGETALVRVAIPVAGAPQLWSPENPELYDASVITRDGSASQQVDRMRIGLRSVRVRHGLLELNGHPLDVRGASIQEDTPGRGPALTDADMDRIVDQLKALHANVTRAHYLLNERLLDKLDAAGILVWSQAPIYHRDRLLVTRAERVRALATLRGTVLGARNHPSVITHSVANELSVVPDEVPGTRAYLAGALGLVRTLDPTLPVSVDLLSYPGYARQRAYARYDLLGVNSYFGWYPGKAAHSTGRLEDLGPYLKRLRKQYPRQGLVLTEFGAESTMAGPAGEKETYAFQSDYIQRVLRIVDELPFMGGAIYWTLREFAVKPHWDGGAKRAVPRDSIHNKGLISYAGQIKPAWRIAETDFADTPLFPRGGPSGPPARGFGPSDVLLIGTLGMLILALLALDAWALLGILRSAPRKERRRALRGEPARASARP